MFKKVVLSAIMLLCSFAVSYSAAKFPFPQQAKYKNGIMPAGVSPKHVQTVYDVWLQGYYEESGDQARIKFDEPANTVSEGIGYGMLIMVFMDNETNNTKAKFDKLWNYYKNHRDGNGLMNWKIQGFTSNTPGSGAATDADLDVAVALIMADKQWGGYASAATEVIGKIKASEVKSNVLVGGDQWTALNPSYMSTVATQLFASLGDNTWSAVQTNCYSLLKNAQAKSSASLWPNWCCDASGTAGCGTGDNPGLYGFDACRTPWRLGWAYAWYGHSDALTLCSKVVNSFKSLTGNDPSKIGQIYNLDGTINTGAKGSPDNIPTYLGPMTVAGMVSSGYQDWLDKGYTRLRAFGGTNDNYYNECLELLSMLLLTGNMPDFTTATPKSSATLTVKANPASGGTVAVSPQKSSYSIGESVTLTATSSNANNKFTGWSGDFEGTNATATIKVNYDMTIIANFKDGSGSDLVDDCEDNDGLTNMGSEWFTYTDVLDGGKSTATPLTKRTTQRLTMTEGGYNGSKYAVKVTYKLDVGSFKYNPFIGVGFEMKADSTALDISSSSGLSFAYKGTFGQGDTCAIKCESMSVTELGASYSFTLPGSTTWKEITIGWDQFLQPKWAKAVALDLKKVPKIQWQIQGATGESGEIWLDDVHLIGMTINKSTGTVPKIATPQGLRNALGCTQHDRTMTVTYSVNRGGLATLSLYDLSGRLVRTLARNVVQPGNHTVNLTDPSEGLSNGSYCLRLASPDGIFTKGIFINR
jgi:endo-1,4-beta-D-glucanase Y